jgi:MerR family transcriptional regulator, copper efflux regulator
VKVKPGSGIFFNMSQTDSQTPDLHAPNPHARNSFTIGQLARETGASVRSLRHYDEHGLLTSTRTSNGYRVFPPEAIPQVRQIQRLIATGFSLAEIRSFPDCMRLIEGAAFCTQTTEAQRQRLASIERQIAELERRRARLLKTLADGVAPPLD